ncbi:MAG: hypothetical protein WCQ45_02875 [bacterium]
MILRASAVLLAAAALSAIAGCSFFGEQGPALTYLEPALSPDGRWLAYECAVDGKLELFARDVETGVAERLTENQADDFSPSWSPDGTSIVFASNRNNNVDIYILEVATRQTRLNFGHHYCQPDDRTDWHAERRMHPQVCLVHDCRVNLAHDDLDVCETTA